MSQARKSRPAENPGPAPPIVTVLSRAVTPLERNQMIEKAAYYHAERRGFEPGHELEDWLAAEQDVQAVLARTDPDSFMDDSAIWSE